MWKKILKILLLLHSFSASAMDISETYNSKDESIDSTNIKYKKFQNDIEEREKGLVSDKEDQILFKATAAQCEDDEISGVLDSNAEVNLTDELLEIDERKELEFFEALFHKYYYTETNNEVSNKIKVAKGLAFFIWGNSGIPLVVPASKVAGNLKGLGYLFGGATFLTVGTSRVWAINEIFKEMDSSIPDFKTNSFHSSKCSTIARHLSCHILGLLSSLPFTYAVYKYNDIKLFALITFLSEYGLGAYAYYNILTTDTYATLKKIFLKIIRKASPVEEEQSELKKKTLIYIDELPDKLLTYSLEERNLFINEMTHLPLEGLCKHIKQAYETEEALQEHNIIRQRLQLTGKILGLLIPISNLVRSSILAHQSAHVVYNSNYFAIPYALMTVIPGLVIDVIATNGTLDGLYELMPNINKPRRSLMRAYYPKVSIAMFSTAMLITGLAGTSNWFITYNTLKDSSLSNYRYFFTITNLAGFITFEAYAMYSTISNLVEYYTYRKGDEEQKNFIRFKNSINRLKKIFSILPLNNLNTSRVLNYFSVEEPIDETEVLLDVNKKSRKKTCPIACSIL